MEISDKIRYFRKKIGITQGKLAELSDIHPVSIRKYETNKAQPQPAQIEKISSALGISPLALNGIKNSTFHLETEGDLLGMLMVLYDSGVIQVKGTRNMDGSVQPDTLKIIFSPILAPFFETRSSNSEHKLEDLTIKFKEHNILDDFLKWDKISYMYFKATQTATINDIPKLEELLSIKNTIELELQSSQNPIE